MRKGVKNFYIANTPGMPPYVSRHYPCVHAVTARRWAFFYHNEIKDLASEYSIDLSKRGFA